jgi:hypothetical protein
MNRKHLAIAAVALAGAFGATWAEARGHSDVQWSVTIGAPAAAVWVGQPAYVYGAPAWSGSYDRGSHDRSYRGREHPSRWDRDGDGIPNRYDRVYNPRWDRDGDGIPNRYDRRDDRYRGHR